jgi:hypothetical protein
MAAEIFKKSEVSQPLLILSFEDQTKEKEMIGNMMKSEQLSNINTLTKAIKNLPPNEQPQLTKKIWNQITSDGNLDEFAVNNPTINVETIKNLGSKHIILWGATERFLGIEDKLATMLDIEQALIYNDSSPLNEEQKTQLSARLDLDRLKTFTKAQQQTEESNPANLAEKPPIIDSSESKINDQNGIEDIFANLDLSMFEQDPTDIAHFSLEDQQTLREAQEVLKRSGEKTEKEQDVELIGDVLQYVILNEDKSKRIPADQIAMTIIDANNPFATDELRTISQEISEQIKEKKATPEEQQKYKIELMDTILKMMQTELSNGLSFRERREDQTLKSIENGIAMLSEAKKS